jgi:hypothetical protein
MMAITHRRDGCHDEVECSAWSLGPLDAFLVSLFSGFSCGEASVMAGTYNLNKSWYTLIGELIVCGAL